MDLADLAFPPTSTWGCLLGCYSKTEPNTWPQLPFTVVCTSKEGPQAITPTTAITPQHSLPLE